MVVTVGDVVAALEAKAPAQLAESWDNVGLQVGNPAAPVRRVVTALEVTDAVLAEATRLQAELIVCHHPLIFRPLPCLRLDDPVAARVARALADGLAVAALHTNFDAAPDGLNDALAAELDLQHVAVLANTRPETLYKLVVFVPVSHVEVVHRAICDAGAGQLGQYSDCTFRLAGTGTFRPLPGATPYVGEIGTREDVDEIRLETIVPASRRERVVRAMLTAHPYEEVAYDLLELANPGPARGIGRLGTLRQTYTLQQFAAIVRDRLGLTHARLAGEAGRSVRVVAVCGGAGASFLAAAADAGADVLVTGDIDHHDAHAALDRGLALIDAGHFGTEKLAGKWLARWLDEIAAANGWPLSVSASEAERDPLWLLP